MKIPLSDRLLACCSFVRRGDRVADVGCDHGYLGIYLLTNGIASSVIESDVAAVFCKGFVHQVQTDVDKIVHSITYSLMTLVPILSPLTALIKFSGSKPLVMTVSRFDLLII